MSLFRLCARHFQALIYGYEPRYATNFPVEFLVGEVTLLGRCTDLSEAGMRGLFRQPMPVGTEGLLTLNYGAIDRAGWSLEVNARVAYFSSEQMVLRFTHETTYERIRLRRFLAAIAQ